MVVFVKTVNNSSILYYEVFNSKVTALRKKNTLLNEKSRFAKAQRLLFILKL